MSDTEKEKKELVFIPFAKLEKRLLNEINRRQMQELTAALNEIYDEHPEIDRDSTDVQYLLRQDFSGVDVKPIIKGDESNGKAR